MVREEEGELESSGSTRNLEERSLVLPVLVMNPEYAVHHRSFQAYSVNFSSSFGGSSLGTKRIAG